MFACTPEEEEPAPQTPDPTQTTDDDDDDDDQNNPPLNSTQQYTVGDLNIEVQLPSDYVEGNRYPTLYFNDGELYADIFGSLSSLEAESFIMVGVWDGNNRAARFSAYQDEALTATYGEYTPSAEAYTKTLVEEVIPFVEAKHKSSKRALFGISLGGLHASWTGIKYPGAFIFTGALSPSYWVGDGALFQESLEALRPMGPSAPKIFYFDRGTAEWRNVMPLVENLKKVELTYGTNIFYYEDIGADHDSPSWLSRIEVPFRLFLEGTADLTDLEVSGYCADNLDIPGSKQARINPIVTYSNGIKFSVMTEAEFQVVSGSGTVEADGSYTINSGNSMTVSCSYMGLTKQISVNQCN
ncbi:MAG: alpha/beta hydrolase-fold protein [Bacteroidota bacterium]